MPTGASTAVIPRATSVGASTDCATGDLATGGRHPAGRRRVAAVRRRSSPTSRTDATLLRPLGLAEVGWGGSRGGTMSQFDLVIRNGLVLDGTGADGPPRRRRGARRARSSRSATVSGDADAHDRRRRRGRRARVRRHPHPLRRSGDVGRAPRPVGVARRHDGRDGQLRRRLRARAQRATATG